MTALVPEGLEPIGVWDTRKRAWPGDGHLFVERVDWARACIPDARSTFRVEFYLLDMPFAVVHRVKRNEDGRVWQDPVSLGPALEEPVVVPVGELPPEHLLRTS